MITCPIAGGAELNTLDSPLSVNKLEGVGGTSFIGDKLPKGFARLPIRRAVFQFIELILSGCSWTYSLPEPDTEHFDGCRHRLSKPLQAPRFQLNNAPKTRLSVLIAAKKKFKKSFFFLAYPLSFVFIQLPG